MAQTVYYVPDGPKNLASLFPGIDWNQVEEYYVEIMAGGSVAGTSPVYKMNGCEEDVRIHFVTYAGGVDCQNFSVTIEHDPTSSTYQSPLRTPLVKANHSIGRFNVKSNDTYTGTACVTEEMMLWLDECLDSPVAWMEWKGTQGQPDDYIPIVISDIKTVKRKDLERFNYEATITFTLSNQRIIISN